MGGAVAKQFVKIGGRSVLARAASAFAAHPMLGHVVVVIHPEEEAASAAALDEVEPAMRRRLLLRHGGATRQASVLNGLRALAALGVPPNAVVLIHDAARPFVPESLITRAIAAGARRAAAVPALAVPDTVALVSSEGAIEGNPDRSSLRLVQTPQAFSFAGILAAHEAAERQGRADFTDDAGLIRWRGGSVAVFPGDACAFKLTTPEDLARAEAQVRAALWDIRSATGYDVHAFGDGDHVMLGGVRIAHDRGVVGHSDADVLLHALTDAVLGCLADGDIGQHFPPSDPRWKGAPSRIFLEEAVRRVHARGGEIRHLDGTVVCESPRIGPHREEIRAMIAGIAGVQLNRVSLKATTSEKLGFTGRREGIAALAAATIALP
jgi:2-C-methyl-D-erythritol 4-phosphate cytidylyltransferase/2-C-methyl-D-erythritol 2,4-cyclodiphosphate synthase